jgi:uncharacterized protein with PQ loop repeat
VKTISLIAAIILPFFNIPLIVKIIRRRSSADFSMGWLMGVWICTLIMAPSGFTSTDIVWRSYNIVNTILFTCVVITVLKYRKK